MSEDKIGSTISAILLVLMFVVGSIIVTYALVDHGNKVEAVQCGHARWVADERGSTSFEWLPRCSQVPPAKESGKK